MRHIGEIRGSEREHGDKGVNSTVKEGSFSGREKE